MSVKRYTWSTEDHAMRESHELGDFVRLADYEAAIADGDLRYENGQRNERLANQDRIRELETALIAVLAQPENPTIWFGVVRGCFKSETPAKHGDGISPQMIGPMEKRMVNEDTIRQIAKQTLPNSSFNIMLAEIDRLRAALRGEDHRGRSGAIKSLLRELGEGSRCTRSHPIDQFCDGCSANGGEAKS